MATAQVISYLLLACVSTLFIAPAQPTSNDCKDTKFDVVIFIDSSNSINNIGYQRQKDFFSAFIKLFNFAYVRFAIVLFSTQILKPVTFSDRYTQEELEEIIQSLPHLKQNTNTTEALRVGNIILRDRRPDAVPITVISTDGRPDEEPSAIAAARQLERDSGAPIFVMGIGSIQQDVLQQLATKPEYCLFIKSFGVIQNFLQILYTLFCQSVQETTTAQPQPAPEPETTTSAPPPSPPPATTTTLAPVPPCTPKTKCSNILFVVDGSSSIGAALFDKNRVLIKRVVPAFSGVVFYGLVTYGTHSYPQCPLTQDINLFLLKVDQMPFRNSSTHTDLGIDSANAYAATHPECQTFIIVITDGESTVPSLTIAAAQRSKDSGFYVVAIAVGPQINSTEINALVSRPEFRLNCRNYDELPGLALKLTTVACNAS